MSVAGIGVDVVDIAGFDALLGVDGTTFLDHFTPSERELRDPARPEPEHLAARWAAKEAFVKAWSAARRGAPPQLGSIDLRHIEVRRDAWGRPEIRLHGAVRQAVDESLPHCSVHLSLSHDVGTAVAMVVIEQGAVAS